MALFTFTGVVRETIHAKAGENIIGRLPVRTLRFVHITTKAPAGVTITTASEAEHRTTVKTEIGAYETGKRGVVNALGSERGMITGVVFDEDTECIFEYTA